MLHPTYLPFTRKQFRQRRRRLGLTCEELGTLAGVDHSTVSLIERGKSRPTAKTANALVDAFKKAQKGADRDPAPELIRPWRLRLGVGRKRLADEAGVSVNAIYHHEYGIEKGKGVRLRKRSTTKRIVDALRRLEREPPEDFESQVR